MKRPYCPFCRSEKPMMKAGWQLRVGGKTPQQKYQCNNRGCYRLTVNPLWRKPHKKVKKEKS